MVRRAIEAWAGVARAPTRQTAAIAVALACAAAISVAAQAARPTFERIFVGATAVGLAATTTNPTSGAQMNQCHVRVSNQPIYVRDDGTNPTGGTGTPLEAGDTLEILGNQYARAIRFILQTTASEGAWVDVRCYQEIGARR